MHMYHRRKRGQGEIVKLIAASARARAVARRRGPHGSAGPGPRASPGACALPLRSRLPLFFSPPPPQTPGPSQPAYPHHKFVHAFNHVLHRDDTTVGQMQRECLFLSLLPPPAPSLKRQASPAPPRRPLLPGPAPVTRATGAHTPALSALAQPCPTPSRPRHQSHSLTPHSGETHYRRISSAPGHSPRAPEEAHRVVVRLQRLQLRERRCRRRGLRGTLTSRAA